MIYSTGTANNFTELLTALTSGITSNGWSNPATDIYSKSTVFVKLTTTSSRIELLCGTGQSAGTLTGTPPLTGSGSTIDGTVSLGTVGATTMQFPCTWYLHIGTSPDEVYFWVNDSTTRWSWLAFGKTTLAGIAGSGNWYSANLRGKNNSVTNYNFSNGQCGGSCAAIFFAEGSAGVGASATTGPTTRIQANLDGNTWTCQGVNQIGTNPGASVWTTTAAQAYTIIPIFELLSAQPNVWNGEVSLIKPKSYVYRGSGKYSPVCELEHIRFLRNDNYNDGDIITIGVEEWKVYPMLMKNTGARNGGTSITHSGTFAVAIRKN